MNDNQNLNTESAEELEAEKSYLADVKEDEIRNSVISDFGFDPEDDKERIDKLTSERLGSKKAISTAIKQKIGYRTKYTEVTKTPPKQASSEVDVDSRISQALEADRLEAMEYPDDIKASIKRIAEIDKISVRKAVNDPTIAARIEKWRKDTGSDEASISRTNRHGKGGSDDSDTPPDVDMNTDEGRKEYDKWIEDQKKKGN